MGSKLQMTVDTVWHSLASHAMLTTADDSVAFVDQAIRVRG